MKIGYIIAGILLSKLAYDYFFGYVFVYAKDKYGKSHKIKVGIKDTEAQIREKINIYMKNL